MPTQNDLPDTGLVKRRPRPLPFVLLGILAGIFYGAMEWLFMVTKPSFMNALPWWENLRILLLSPLPLVLGSVVVGGLLWGLTRLAPGGSRLWTRLALLWPSGVLAAILLLMLDNFTYTLWRVGVLTTTRSRCYLYLGVILLFWSISYSACRRKQAQWLRAPKRTERGTVFALAGLGGVWTVLLLVGYERLRPVQVGDTLARRPNILLLASDGVNADRTSLYGYERDTTPFMTEFFRGKSLFCENAFANALNSSGSIASLLTGKLPTTLRVYYPPDILTGRHSYEHLPGMLRHKGYRTVDISQRRFGDGFDLNLLHGFLEANWRTEPQGWWRSLTAHAPAANTVYFLQSTWERLRDRVMHAMHLRRVESAYAIVAQDLTGKKADDRLRLERLKQWIAGPDERPFFAHVHLLGTHGPWFHSNNPVFSLGKTQQHKFERDFYDDAVLSFDCMAREIVEALEQAGTLDNTVIVLHSDHGQAWRNLRVPLVFRFPGGRPARRIAANAQNIDIAPTLLDYLGLPVPSWMEGMSLLDDDPPPRRPVFSVATDAGAVNQHKGKVMHHRTTPPFHSLGFMLMNLGDRAYSLNLITGEFSHRRTPGHTAPTEAGAVTPLPVAHGMMIDHLASRDYYR